jgi:hypothetical protein
VRRLRLTTLTFLVVLGAIGCDSGGRKEEVARRGRLVMPFDLDRTTHTFQPRPDGGVQEVVADRPDQEQVRLIRDHLQKESEAFPRGDFGDPARIHGDDMPGLTALIGGYDRIRVTYEQIRDGGRIVYTTSDEDLVEAIHEWFAAQVSDHGEHAEHAD